MSELSGPAAYGLKPASEELMARRERLAERIREELNRAGLPARRERPDAGSVAGAGIHVDIVDEVEGGGVFVSWHVEESLRRAALGLPEGELTDEDLDQAAKALPYRGKEPALLHVNEVSRLMQAAVIGILCSAGLRAYDPDEEYDPCLVQVDVP
jgi:hypothetical protein